jgi:hypothetical protein
MKGANVVSQFSSLKEISAVWSAAYVSDIITNQEITCLLFPLMVTGKMLCTYVHTYNVILWGLICQIVNEIKVILRSAKAYNVLRTFRNLRNVDIVTTLRKIAGVGNKS